MRTLYQFPLSHFCEKSRWLLDYKELDYVAHNLTPGVHRIFTQRKAGVNTVPLLHDHDFWINDSTKIAQYLEKHYPENHLIHTNPTINRHIFKIDDMANQLGIDVRRWILSQMILENSDSVDILLGEKGYLQKFKKYSKPMLSFVLKKQYELNSNHVVELKQSILNRVNVLNQQFINTNTGYMTQDHFTFADISVCSMIAPLLNIEGTPWEIEKSQQNPKSEIEKLKESIFILPIGKYVIDIYKNQRNARVDWRGT
ncbi:glutathione S-transferase [Acinetobacter sp. B10A]|uniref:glutathione S-transferase family protein n=1 Tax=Acinetobacter baretiae TaxID=2605383 RepID=UPI001B3C6A09|nr:glutathione S-transferase [Acinetobacter baretiae]MBF7685888.1 glutathione S-transferase [Acinetobacter baretiae]